MTPPSFQLGSAMHASLAPLVERCVERFCAWTGHAPTAVAAAPGRVNLIGEHTDYNDGFVLPMAIDRWCVAAGAVGEGRVRSEELGAVAAYQPDRPDASGLAAQPWARYPVGVIWCMRERVPASGWRGVDVLLASSVPLGAGLSSSASVEIATAALVDRLFGCGLSPRELAAIGRRAEHEFAGVPCGIMDQLISAAATAGAATLIDCRTLEMRSVSLPPEAAIVITDSGVRHALASGEYAKRRQSCERAAKALGVMALRDADLGMLASAGSAIAPVDVACARHVITENARVQRFAAAALAGDLAGAGRLMHESHVSLRDDYHVSCGELDTLVAAAMSIPGVYGSRMTGGGFGGCTVTLCSRASAADVCTRLRDVALTVAAPGVRPVPPFVAIPVGPAAAWAHRA